MQLSIMTEPKNLQQCKDEVSDKNGYETWEKLLAYHDSNMINNEVIPDFVDDVATLYRQSFIDSLRGKIEAKVKECDEKVLILINAENSNSNLWRIRQLALEEILSLLNEGGKE